MHGQTPGDLTETCANGEAHGTNGQDGQEYRVRMAQLQQAMSLFEELGKSLSQFSADLRHLLKHHAGGNGSAANQPVRGNGATTRNGIPHWNENQRKLSLGSTVVKWFRRPAVNQEIILSAFEEEGWPERIWDPLPAAPGKDSKERLHDAIRRLNDNQLNHLIRFRGDGNGEGILWERV